METVWQDFRFGFRMLLKSPGFTIMAVLIIALCIGANTAIFSVVNAILLRPLPFANPDRLVKVWSTNISRGLDEYGTAPPDFREWSENTQALDQMAAYYSGEFNLLNREEPEQIRGVFISPNLFRMLGVDPAMGRNFTSEEEQFGRHRVVLLSDGLWHRRFNADPNLLGQAITLDAQRYVVVGIMSPDFRFFNFPGIELWTPMAFEADSPWNTRGNRFLDVVARLKPGVTVAQAQADMESIASRLEQEYKQNAGVGAKVVPLQQEIVGRFKLALNVLLAAVGFVLLIACANVANLLLARAAGRHREIAIRISLGAGRSRIIRMLLTESLLLGLLGGIIGVALAVWCVDALIALGPAELRNVGIINVDGMVLIFTLGITLLTSTVFGLAPALQLSKPDSNETLKEGTRGSTGGVRGRRIRSILMVAEVALALVLLIGAGLMIKSFLSLQKVNPGFNPENALTMVISLPASKYPATEPHKISGFYQQALNEIEQIPGVQFAGASSSIPLIGDGRIGKRFSIEGKSPPVSLNEVPMVMYRQISPNFLRALGIPILKGQPFTERDNQDAPGVAIINETLANSFFPNEDPIGKKVWMGPPEDLLPPGVLPPNFRFPRLTVIGVVGDLRQEGLQKPVDPEVYVPHLQGARRETVGNMFVVVRTNSDPMKLASVVQSRILAIDKDQPIANVVTMEKLLADSLSQPRFNMLLLGIFAGMALVMAVAGIYGVASYSVSQRTHEIGIRMALGAQQSDVLKLIIGQGLILVTIGLVLGLGAAFALTRLMTSLLYGVSVTDPLTFAGIALLLAGVALVANYIPARRATQVDPMEVLRFE